MSFGDYVKSKGDSEKDSGHQRKKLRATIEDRLTVDGACGRVLRFMDLNLEDGQTYKWYFLHPCALLCELCKVCGSLGDLINQVHQGTLQLAFYQDEIKPGNILRPDQGRTVCCWYWTIVQLPQWFQTRREGYFFFGAFPTKLLHVLKGGYSYLFARILSIFFELEEPVNFTTGFPLTCSKGYFLCKGTFSILMSDEKAIKELWLLRGASGTKPCCVCQNVLGHMNKDNLPMDGRWLVHYACPDRTKFAKHTTASYRAMRDHLESLAGRKKDLQKFGQVYGLQYDPNGVLWHPTLRNLICPVQHTMYDWMHVLVASGGVAQYEVNGFLTAVQSIGIKLERVDAFASAVHIPKSRGRLPKKFFEDRYNPDEKSHIKCFAGELLTAMPILILFCEIVLQPCGQLLRHSLCLQYMADILDILTHHNAVQQVSKLQMTIDNHNQLFAELYPDCTKPKYHWLFHISEQISHFKVNLSCFCPERKHRAVKSIANHCFNDSLNYHVTLRMGNEVVNNFSTDKTLCQAMCLHEPVREVLGCTELLWLFDKKVVKVLTSRHLTTLAGKVSPDDIVFAPSLKQILRVHAFLEVSFLSGNNCFVVQASTHQWKEGCLFDHRSKQSFVVWENNFLPVAYTERLCGSIHACLQTLHRDMF